MEGKPYIYIVLLTSRNDAGDMVSGLEAGADDYVVKPFDPQELKVRVRAGRRVVQLQEDLLKALEISEFRATHDVLTGIWNRAAIFETLRRELARARREGTPVGAIIADVDHFKRINDEHGHLTGDAVLKAVAQRLITAVRPYDSVGRYGGEEFLMVLPGCDLDDAGNLAERLCSLFDVKDIETSEGTFHITLSCGVAAYRGLEEPDIDSLIRSADEALYRAKRLGRNRVEKDPGAG
jgi:diguanylate cyclase (GGDEF)-like protein